MDLTKVKTVRRLAAEVADLARIVETEEDRRRDTGQFSVFYGSKQTSALRRRSMDLTRALADLRRGA